MRAQGRVRTPGGSAARTAQCNAAGVTVIGLEFAFLIGGLGSPNRSSIERSGQLFVQAVTRSDFTMVQALVLLVATFFIIVNFAIDLLYAWLDPRIRYR